MFNPGSSQLSTTAHPENIVFFDKEETHNDILPLPPNNDDSFSFHDDESFSSNGIIVDKDGFAGLQEFP